MSENLGPYKIERVVQPHGRGTQWHIINRLGRALVWTTDPAEAYHLLDLLNDAQVPETPTDRLYGQIQAS